MGYVKELYDERDGRMNRDQLLQHAAGQAKAANDTVGTALEQLSVLRRQMADLQANLDEVKVHEKEAKALLAKVERGRQAA